MAASKRLASTAFGPEIDHDQDYDYDLPRAEGWLPELSSARRAAMRAEKAMESARAGDTTAALSGNIFVSQAIFAELLKRGQEANGQLLEEVQAKDREIADLQAKLEAQEVIGGDAVAQKPSIERQNAKDREIAKLRARLEAQEAIERDVADLKASIESQEVKDREIAKLRARLEAQEAIERDVADLKASIESQEVKDREIANLRASLEAWKEIESPFEELRASLEDQLEDQLAKEREIAQLRASLDAYEDIESQISDLRANIEDQDVKDREIQKLRAKIKAQKVKDAERTATKAASVKQRVIVVFRAGYPAMTITHRKKIKLAKVILRYKRFIGHMEEDEDLVAVSRNENSNGVTVDPGTTLGGKGCADGPAGKVTVFELMNAEGMSNKRRKTHVD